MPWFPCCCCVVNLLLLVDMIVFCVYWLVLIARSGNSLSWITCPLRLLKGRNWQKVSIRRFAGLYRSCWCSLVKQVSYLTAHLTWLKYSPKIHRTCQEQFAWLPGLSVITLMMCALLLIKYHLLYRSNPRLVKTGKIRGKVHYIEP